MKEIQILLLATAVFGLSGCCMKSIEIKPQMDSLDLKTAKVGSFNADIKLELKECCPTKEQKIIALSIQSKMEELYTKLLNDEITLETYNAKIKAASNAIKNVVLVCSTTSETKALSPSIKTMLPSSQDQAWIELKKINDEF